MAPVHGNGRSAISRYGALLNYKLNLADFAI